MTPARRRLLLALLIVAGVINYADRQVIAILKPVIEGELGWTDADYGRLTSAFQFAAAASFLGVGWIVDRIGLKWANPLGVAAWSLAAAAHAVCRTLPQFLVARVALGATEAMGTPAAIKSIAAWFDARQRSVALGAMNAAGNAGAIVTPLIVPPIALALGWRAAFVVLGAVGLAWALAWMLLTRGQDWKAQAAGGAADAAEAEAEVGARIGWSEVLKERRTWAVAGAKALSDQVWWLLLFWTPDLFHRVFHLDMAATAAPLVVIYSCAALGSLAGGFASSRLMAAGLSLNTARKAVMLVSALLVTPAPLVLHVQSYWSAVALLGLMLAAHQGFSVNLFALITDVTPARKVGSVTAIGALSGNLSGMAVLALAGVLLSSGGGYGPLFWLAAFAYLLALGWIQLLLPVLRPPQA